MAKSTTPIKSTKHIQFTFFKLFVTTAILLFCTTIHAATYYSRANTAWNVPSTWSTTGYGGTAASSSPAAGDVVNIGNSNSITVTANASCASLTIDVTGVMTPSGTSTVNATTGITINGTYTNQSTGTITTPSWNCNGTYNHATSSMTLPLGTTTSTWAANSNMNITGSYTTATVFINFIGQTFGNFTFNPSSMTNTVALIGAAGTTTILGNYTITQTGNSTLYNRIYGQQFASTININGNFTLTAGIYDLHNGGTTVTNDGINLKGNFTLSGTSVLTETTTQTGSTVGITFMGPGVQAVSIASTAAITSQATTPTCAILFTVASGSTIDMGTSVLTGSNNTSFVLSPGASIITANSGGLSASGATGSIQVAGSRSFSTTANYTYNGSSAQVTGTGLPATVNNMTISNSAGVTFTAAETINGTLALGTTSVINPNTFAVYAVNLTIGGITQATGSYGGTGSGATHINTANFAAGTGQVHAGAIPPTNLSYTTPNTFPTATAIAPLSPTVTGTVTSYSVSPALPSGLSLNTSTGVISGTPSVNTASASYTVTASNAGGSTTFAIVIIVGNKRYAVNASSAAWNVTSTWSATSGGTSGASVPVAGDAVFIGDAAVARVVTIPTGYSAACDSLTIGNSSNSTANSLTLTDNTVSLSVYKDVNINRSNGNNNTNALNVNAGTVSVSGSVNLAGTNTTTSRINTIVITTGSLTIAGNLTFIAGVAANNIINMSGGAGTLNLAGAFNATVGTLTPGTTSTFNYTGANQTITDVSSIAYNHLTFSGSGTKTLMAAMTSIAGNLTLSGTTSATTVANLAIGGNLTIGTGTALTTASNFTLSVGNTSSITGSLTLAGTGTKTFTGDVTLNAGGIWNETGNAAVSFGGSLTNNASFTSNAGTHTFSGTAKTLSGSAAIVIPSTAITGTYTNSGTLTCSTTLSGTGGLTQGTTGILNIGGTSAISTLTATATGNTVTYNGGIQTVKGTAYYNLTLSGNGAKTTTAVTVNNVLSMEGTSAATASVAPTYGAGATLQYNTTSAMTTGLEWIPTFLATGGVIITNTGTITLSAAKVLNASVPLTINANASLATGSFQLTFGGNFINAGTFTAGSSPIVITNSMTTQSIAGFTTTGNVSMTKTAGTATFQGYVNATSLTVNGTGGSILHLGTGNIHTFTGTITLTAGTLNGGSSVLNENATSATAWNGTGSVFTPGTGTVVFGGLAQTLGTASTFYNLIFTNSGLKTLTGVPTINNLLSIEGTATSSGTPVYGSTATLQYKGSGPQTTGSEFVSPFTGSGGVKINNSNGVTLGSARSLGANPFTIGDIISGSQFNDGGFLLTATGTLNLTSGYYSVKSASFPAFTTTNITTGTTVDYAATATQTVKGITYSNLSISGTGTNSKKADGNVTVNGILNLSSGNASATQGCLDMNTTPFILTMGATATTNGTGDVTGIVTRNSFVVNTPYSFGNQFTTLSLQAGGALSTSISIKILLTSTHTWKTDAINRYYDIIQTGGTIGTTATLNLHYLSGELNGATEGNLDLFDYHAGTDSDLDDHGHSNYNTSNKWVGLANLSITYIAPTTTFPSNYWTLGTSTEANFTWVGGTSTNWTTAANWVGGNIPGTNDAVIIPQVGVTNFVPTLPASATIGSIDIQPGGILNATTGSPTLTISGGTGAWENQGTFNAGSSTVVFTNAAATMADPTNFYNLTVANGANLTLGTDNIMRIGGTLSLSSTGVLNAANNHNTIEYNGTNQTVILPNGSTPGYHDLILSGSGTKTLPSSAMTVYGDLILNGTANATAANALNIVGNVLLSSGTTFTPSTFTHTVSGNWTNNGATFAPVSGTISFNNPTVDQIINGTAASQTFYNVVTDKTSNTLSVGGSTTSLTVNNLTVTSGNFLSPATLTVNGNVTLTSGSLTSGSVTTAITGNVILSAGTYIAGATTNLSGNWTNNGATFTAGTGMFNLNGSLAQTMGGTTSNTFNNITVNNTAGVTASADQTVNGILNLPDANPSSTTGSLDMGSHTLYLGITGTDTGIGDVTGTITHQHPFTINTSYTFGHPNSRLRFNDVPGGQTFPSMVSVNVSIGTAIAWPVKPANAVKRQFILRHTGGSGNAAIFRASYLDSELASGTNESTLSFWSFIPTMNILTDQGWSNYDVTQNFISLSDVDFTSVPDTMYVGLAPTLNTRTWNGYLSTDWNTSSNWTPNGVPTADQGVIIPDTTTTTYNAILPAGAVCQYVIIQSGGRLNTANNATLNLSGSGNVWSAEPAITGLSAGKFNAGNSTVTISNTSASATLLGSTDFYNLNILSGVNLRMNIGSYAGISGALINNGIFDTRTSTNTIEFKGTGQVIANPNFTIPGYSNLIINSSASSPVWPDILNIGGTFTNNLSGLSITSTVVMDGPSAQTITGLAATTFNDLTINNSFGVTGATNMTVNGVLTFISDNPSSNDRGALAMATDKILDMGVNSSTTGPGEVSGIIRRSHSFTTATPYSFGDENNNLTFAAVSGEMLPSSVSLKVSIGTTPNWSANVGAILVNPISRLYGLVQTGGSGTRALMQVHYRDNEIPTGVTESNLTIWTSSYLGGTSYYTKEAGRSGYSTTSDYVTIQDVDFAIIPSTWGYFNATLAPSSAVNHTWIGTISTDWADDSNWTPNGAPNSSIGAIIPSTYTTPYAPILPATATCSTLQINAAGVLNAPTSGGTFTITGSDAAWSAESNAVFNANTSTIVFSNTTADVSINGNNSFYNMTVGTSSLLRPAVNSYTSIGGALTINGTLAAATNDNTFEFNGNSTQSIPNPNGSTPGYHHLLIDGSGTKNAVGAIAATGNFTITSGKFVLNTATNNDLTIGGNFLQTGGVFDFNSGSSGTCNMYLSGNFTQTTGDGSMTTSGAGAPNGIVIFNGTGLQTLNLTDPAGPIWTVFSVPTGKNVQLLSNISLNSANGSSQTGFQGEIRVNGTLDLGTYNVSQAGGVAGTALFTVNAGATFITSNAGGVSGSVSSTNMTNTFSSGANYEFHGAATGTFTTTPTVNTVNNLTINNSSNTALTNSINVAGVLSLTNGTLSIGGNTLTLSGSTPSIGIGNIDATASNATVGFAGSSLQNVPSGLFYNNSVYNLIINNSNNVILNGNLSLEDSLKVTAGKLDASTNLPTLSYAGTSAQTIVANQYLNNNIYNLSIDNPAGVSLNADLNVNNLLTVNSGNSLTITPAVQLNVAGTITNNAGISGLVVKSSPTLANGTIIFHNSGGSPVLATVEMYSKASWDLTNQTAGGKYKWEFFGIPVTTLTTSPMFDGDYVRQYNEAGKGSGYTTTNRWIQLVNGSTLSPFTGYELTQPAGRSYSFQGQLINSDFTQVLSYTPGSDYPGEHLLSNPYTAAIDITKLTFGGDLDQTVYLYNTGSLADWQSQSGSGGNPGQYIAAPQSTAGIGGVPGQIPSMQGFLILMNTATPTSTTFGIPYSSVATKNNDLQRVKSDQNVDKIFTRIDVTGSRFSDKMWIFTDPSCSHSFDNGWDGAKFLGSTLAPQIYAMENDGDYQVNSVDNINNTNIGFLAGEDTNYTLKFTHESVSSQYSSLYLVDLQENTSTDITQSGTLYSFTAQKTALPVNRFKIVTSAEIATNNPKTDNKYLKIFNSKQTIIVQNSTNYAGKIIIVEVSGRILNTVFMKANGTTTIPTELPAGTYIVKGITSIEELDKLIIIP